MTAPAPVADALDLAAVRTAVDRTLEGFLADKLKRAEAGEMGEVIGVLDRFLRAGGKRLRPLLCVCGWHAAGGGPGLEVVLRAAAALELFHAFALIHDDVMDGSDTRRGHPSAHRALQAVRGDGDVRAAEWFGISSAILLGDLALIWSDELLTGAPMTAGQHLAVRPVLDIMRSEVMQGQYLDLLATGKVTGDLKQAMDVVRYKTAKYTIERPLHVGAVLAGGSPADLEACTAYALPIGEAFQLRDDLLGVFGDPRVTGKSDLDDLREGKRTPLVAIAVQRADEAQLTVLRSGLGRADLDETDAAAIRGVLEATGARQCVEEMIIHRHAAALQALERSGFPPAVTAALKDIARAAAVRSS
ncbi:geranylgeranyl diphosphate synthase [Streptomyces rimosus subsp. pseudoverticillatus]|uniref:polyprenyl synthetase family protein n=1 Tax=Streptomyces rimosus TaxID=1927 RepID=UPI0006B290B2|nr:polyprenyl synthetase family protein [Streptomyces rimosus]KOT97715.1 geranylgeranyl diphosphate synthase [Streptomyces rimosus subsp. pseudoverticillatus]